MKKFLLLGCVLFFGVLISGCSKDKKDTIKVMIPSGAPTLGFVQMMHDDKSLMDYQIQYDVKNGVDPLVSAMTSKSHQIVVAPTNVGAKLYTKNGQYIYAGTITFGNLYLVSNQPISFSDLDNQTIYAFGKGGTPDILLNKVLETKPNIKIEYKNSVNDVSSLLTATNSDTLNISLVAEPILSVIKSKKTIYQVLDIQSEYQKITNSSSYPQAGIFIERDFALKHKELVDEFLKDLQDSIQFVNQNKEEAANYYTNLFPDSFSKSILMQSIPGSNIQFKNSQDSKPLLEQYFTIVNVTLPDSGFYLTN